MTEEPARPTVTIVEFHRPPQMSFEDVAIGGGPTPTHRKIAMFDAYADPSGQPLVSVTLPLASLDHDAFTAPDGTSSA